MQKKNLDTGQVRKDLSYRVSAKIMDMHPILLFLVSVLLAVCLGWTNTETAAIIKNVVNGDKPLNRILEIYILIDIVFVVITFMLGICDKALRLNIVNIRYLELYDRVFNSKITDISNIGTGKILESVNSIACLNAEIGSAAVNLVRILIPFSIVIIKIGMLNLYAAIGMAVTIAVCILFSLNGDKWFHFDEIKSSMKGDMRNVSVNNFMVVQMMKYMDAFKFAHSRLNEAQDVASPAMHNSGKFLYNALINTLSNLPVLIALIVSIKAEDTGLAVFVAINEWTMFSMIDVVTSIAEMLSEKHGESQVISQLKGDDIPYEEKPVMPEHLDIENVTFYYDGDTEKMNPYEIEHFHVERGQRYRFSAPSGWGKSTFFKYFAGIIDSDKPFNVRTFYIHQNTELLAGTLRDNITFGNRYVPDQVIEELLKDVRLWDWYIRLPNGLDTKIGSGGIEPSGGEASRISLLRLFIHIRNYQKGELNPVPNKTDIIILDEVTSALDKRDVFIKDDELSTEEAIIKVIDRETKGCTMFVISHEDISSSAFGFKDIVNKQLLVTLKKTEDGKSHHVLTSMD